MQTSVLLATMRAVRSMASSHAALQWAAAGSTAGWASAAASPLAQALKRGMHSLGSSCHQALPSMGYRSKHSSAEAGTSVEADPLHVTVEPQGGDHEGVSVINLNRPNARNAIGRQLLRELAEAINILRQERSTRCVILRSAVPGVFCAGADLKERAMMTQDEATEFVNSLRRTLTDLQTIPIPTIAAIDGYALGGGAELALACDIRVIGPDATFAFPEAQLGIIPGAGGTQRLPRLIGAAKAKELIFTCRKVSAVEAIELGLAEHGVQDGSAYTKALDLARSISHSAPLSLRMAKEAINQGLNMDLGSGLKHEEACYARLLPTKDRHEGLKAFAEKRRPVYTGE